MFFVILRLDQKFANSVKFFLWLRDSQMKVGIVGLGSRVRQNPPHVADVADVAASQPEIAKIQSPQGSALPTDTRHGFAVNGQPKTWTGNIVSLDQWRRLSEWEKHGPDGRHWNGVTQKWEQPK